MNKFLSSVIAALISVVCISAPAHAVESSGTTDTKLEQLEGAVGKSGASPSGTGAAPHLRDADCSVWHTDDGTVRWDLPADYSPRMHVRVTQVIGTNILSFVNAIFPASDQGIFHLPVPRGGDHGYELRFEKNGKLSPPSSVIFHQGITPFEKCTTEIRNGKGLTAVIHNKDGIIISVNG